MVNLPLLLACGVLILAVGAEVIHAKRVRKVAALAFGPQGRPGLLGRLSPLIRISGLVGMVWGLTVLATIVPRTHRSVVREIQPADRQHLLVVLDVSPSMRIKDGGKEGKQSRMQRAREVLDSIFARISTDRLHTSVVAVYNGAKPVVEQTRDLEVLHNLMNDLPMHHAFPAGKTRLFDGLSEAARITKYWPRNSTTLLLVSDGDSVPATGMPAMPSSVGGVLVIGVGDPSKGTSISGHQSRQDGSTLRQIATRLGGAYHDANVKFVPTTTLGTLGSLDLDKGSRSVDLREWAIAATVCGTLLLTLLPLGLHLIGSRWNPGPKAAARIFPAAPRSAKITI